MSTPLTALSPKYYCDFACRWPLPPIDRQTECEQVSKGARALRPQWLAGITYPRCAFNSNQANLLFGFLCLQ